MSRALSVSTTNDHQGEFLCAFCHEQFVFYIVAPYFLLLFFDADGRISSFYFASTAVWLKVFHVFGRALFADLSTHSLAIFIPLRPASCR